MDEGTLLAIVSISSLILITIVLLIRIETLERQITG